MSTNPNPTRPALGLPVWGLALLSLVAAPRVVLHDLGLATDGIWPALLALGPALVWIAVIVYVAPRRPISALVVVGAFYGAALALVHNLLWDQAFAAAPPTLGGNLTGVLASGTEEVVMRLATTFSSLVTGVIVGLVCGLVAAGLLALTKRRERFPNGVGSRA